MILPSTPLVSFKKDEQNKNCVTCFNRFSTYCPVQFHWQNRVGIWVVTDLRAFLEVAHFEFPRWWQTHNSHQAARKQALHQTNIAIQFTIALIDQIQSINRGQRVQPVANFTSHSEWPINQVLTIMKTVLIYRRKRKLLVILIEIDKEWPRFGVIFKATLTHQSNFYAP